MSFSSCTKYTRVPLQCSLTRDPDNLCCQIMTCDPQKVVTLGFETITPPTAAHPNTIGSTTTIDHNAPVTPRPVPTLNTPNGTVTVPTSQRPVAGKNHNFLFKIFKYHFSGYCINHTTTVLTIHND